MQTRRNTALKELERLAEELRNNKVVSSDRTLVTELNKICYWANNEGAKSSLPEINRRMDYTKEKVGERLIVFCAFMHLNHFVGSSFGRNHNSGSSC